jgi:hypothetical protein
VQLSEVFKFVGWICRWRRILRLVLAVIDWCLIGLLLCVLVGFVVTNRRSSNERPAPCSSPKSHLVRRLLVGIVVDAFDIAWWSS